LELGEIDLLVQFKKIKKIIALILSLIIFLLQERGASSFKRFSEAIDKRGCRISN
jgi:hypothetical protein